MSHTMAKDPASLHTTRQLLDELDELMERMLAVPVEDGEAGDAASTPAVGATLTMLEQPGTEETDADAFASSEADADPASRGISYQEQRGFEQPALADQTSERDYERAYETAPAFSQGLDAPPSYVTAPTPDAGLQPAPSVVEVIVPAPQPLAPLPARLRPSRALGYQFLLWVNRGYDHGTFLLGRRGRWLRNRTFRLGLGLSGGVLLAAALTWLIWDWFALNQ